MANKIQIKRGVKSKLPTLSVGEPGLATDTSEVFIGGSSGNIQLAKYNDIAGNIINNLTTGGSTKSLSAEQGKLLNANITLLKDTELNINFFTGTSKEQKLVNMLTFASANGYKRVFVPSGTYDFTSVISDSIVLPEAFKKIVIVGENPKDTIFKYGHLSNKPFIKVLGGSGSLCQGYIENIRFEGSTTTTAIQLADVCGYKVKNCSFSTNKIGVHFYNDKGFTEYCLVEGCDFEGNCMTSIEYSRRSGNEHESFHGSGMKDCTINQNPNASANIIINTGCLLYNTPLDFTIWTSSAKPIILNNGSALSNCYGNIRVETFGSNSHDLVSGTELHYIGGVEDWGGYTKYEKIKFMENIVIHNGGISGKVKPNTRSKGLVQGDNVIMACNNDYELNITVIGAFYRYCGHFIIGKNPQANEIYVTKLAEHSLFDQMGKGHVVVKGSGANVVISVPAAIDGLNVNYTFRTLN